MIAIDSSVLVDLLADDGEPARFDDWERGWVPAELLRPVGEITPS